MTLNFFYQLPTELYNKITENLNDNDFINLSLTCSLLYKENEYGLQCIYDNIQNECYNMFIEIKHIIPELYYFMSLLIHCNKEIPTILEDCIDLEECWINSEEFEDFYNDYKIINLRYLATEKFTLNDITIIKNIYDYCKNKIDCTFHWVYAVEDLNDRLYNKCIPLEIKV